MISLDNPVYSDGFFHTDKIKQKDGIVHLMIINFMESQT